MSGLAVIRSVYSSFPHVRCFMSVEGWGVHILASMEEIEPQSPEETRGTNAASAKQDLLEWAPDQEARAYLGKVMFNEAATGKTA